MSEFDAILFAHAAFYAAFTARDMRAMEHAWAHDKPVSCIHPGRVATTGRDAVLRSWQAIIGNPDSPGISSHAEKVQLYGDLAVVTCVEQLTLASGRQFLAATNVFTKAGALWFLVHHQAGPLQGDPGISAENEPKPPLN